MRCCGTYLSVPHLFLLIHPCYHKDQNSFAFKTVQYSSVYISLSIYPLIGTWLTAAVTNTAMNMDMQITLQHIDFSSFGFVSNSGTIESHSSSVFSFMRNIYTIFHNSCAQTFPFPQQ